MNRYLGDVPSIIDDNRALPAHGASLTYFRRSFKERFKRVACTCSASGEGVLASWTAFDEGGTLGLDAGRAIGGDKRGVRVSQRVTHPTIHQSVSQVSDMAGSKDITLLLLQRVAASH